MAPVQLNIVCFRYRAADADRVNREIVADIQESGIAAPSTTVLDGQLAIRAAIVNHRTDTCDIDALICGGAGIRRAARRLNARSSGDDRASPPKDWLRRALLIRRVSGRCNWPRL